jgi:membrane protein implicated in regulation of membrane protease activity
MKKATAERLSIALFISSVTSSAIIMLWLLWRFPIATAVTALIVLAGVSLVARVAKTLDTEPSRDNQHPNPTA